MREKRGRGRGAPLPNELVSQYRYVILPKTNDDSRTYENDANALSWHMVNASFWASACIGPIQVNCFGMGCSQSKKNKRGKEGGFKPQELFCFFSVSLEISET